MKTRILLSAIGAGATLCAGISVRAAAPLPTTISYEAGPCLFHCPVYRMTISSNGRGTFQGRSYTAFVGTRSFHVTNAQFQAFARRLAPYRPSVAVRRLEEAPACQEMATDQASVSVSWSGAGGAQRLSVYYGCDMETNRVMFNVLANAPFLLPIRDYIAHRR